MAELTRDEFAAICGVSRNAINTYIGRRKINVLRNKLIDPTDELNKVFVKLRKQKSRNRVPVPINRTTKRKNENITKPGSKSKSDDSDDDEWYKRKMIADAIKAETDSELKKLQLEKMMGKLIPVDLMHGIFKINVQNVFRSFENELVNLASIYTDILAGGDRSKLSEIVDVMRQNLSRIIKETKNNAAKEIEGVINEYSETRSRGERK